MADSSLCRQILAKRFVLPDRTSVLVEIDEALRSGWLARGQFTERLEVAIAAEQGTAVLGTASAMDALEIVLDYLEPVGRRVFLPANCFQAVPSLVLAAGAVPVPLAVSPTTYSCDLAPLEEEREPGLLIHVQAFGIVAEDDLQRIERLRRRGWFVILDSANILPETAYLKRNPKGEGLAELLSFNPTKAVASAKGGALMTADLGLARYAVAARAHSGGEHIWHGGGHLRRDRQIGEINAIIAFHQWQRRQEIAATYRRLDAAYGALLKSGFYSVTANETVSLSPPTRRPVLLPEGRSVFGVACTMSERAHISCSVMYGVPWTDHAAFADLGITDAASRRLIARTLCLPLHEAMNADDPRCVVEALEEVLCSDG